MKRQHISTTHKWGYSVLPFEVSVNQLEFDTGKTDPEFYISIHGKGISLSLNHLIALHKIIRLVLKDLGLWNVPDDVAGQVK